MSSSRLLAAAVFVALAAGSAHGQDPANTEDRSTGLPSAVDWTFNIDGAFGAFGFGNSLFTDPKEHVRVDYGQNWFEGFIKPGLSGTYALPNSSELYGTLSIVGEGTYNAPRPVLGPIQTSFGPEDASIGWRSGTAIHRYDENAIDVVFGRTTYTLGHGMLLWDGGAEGGTRGGYWSNARKAFALAAIGRFKPGDGHTIEAFYLDKNDLPENETGSGLWGANYEYRIGETSTFGVTYMEFHAKPEVEPLRDGLDVLNARAYTAPFPALEDLSFELEYASERNDDVLSADAWTAQVAYEFTGVGWTPQVSYRYAFFEGDDPATTTSESFDPLFTGFYDWSSWWQGEIAGEYFLSNSNLKSHLVRVRLTPTSKLDAGVIFYKFLLDVPSTYGPNVTDKNLAVEVDGYADWKINENFTASFVAAFADPQDAVRQNIGRTANFRYGMVFLAYSY